MASPKVGALAGWTKDEVTNGIVLTVELASSAESFENSTYQLISIVMNDRQLRSLTRDLTRSAETRGIELFGKRPWWKL